MDQRLLVIKKGGTISIKLLQRFEQEGYQVRYCMEKELISSYLTKGHPSIIILEGWLPWELQEIISHCTKSAPQVPLVVLSKEGDVEWKVLILEIGAYDYIEIPYHMDELVARVKTHLRSRDLLTKHHKKEMNNGKIFHFNYTKNEAYKNHQRLHLSVREFQLLKFLMAKERLVFSRRDLLNKVWGYGEKEELYCDIRTVDVTVRRIREKIEDNPKKPKYLLTKRGIGYYFENGKEDEQ